MGKQASDAKFAADAIDYCYSQGWTDGLPVVPCSQELLDEFLAQTSLSPDHVLLEVPHIGRSCSVRMAAVNAAMAGCLPQYFPTVLAVWRSLALEAYSGGVMQSTTGTAPLIVVNGPVREQIGINSSGNVFGPGFRANATIGRAVRLAILNVFDIRPHRLDQSTQGTSAKYTCCMGENEEGSPWKAMHEEFGFDRDQSTATIFTVRSASHIEARHTASARQLLHDICGSIARTGALMFRTTSSCLVLAPEHAALLASQGWDKPSIREFVFETARLSQGQLDAVGKGGISSQQHWRLPRDHADAQHDDLIDADRGLRVLTSPSALQVIVAGAANSGVSAVFDMFDLVGETPSICPIEARTPLTAIEGEGQ